MLLLLCCVLCMSGKISAQEKIVDISFCESNITGINLTKAIGIHFPDGAGKWYDASTNEEVSNIFVPRDLKDSYKFYFLVESGQAACDLKQNSRYEVNIYKLDIPVPETNSTMQMFCVDSDPLNVNTLANIDLTLDPGVDGAQWYDAPTGGTKLPDDHQLEDNTTYYAASKVDGCGVSLGRCAVTVDLIEPDVVINNIPAIIWPGFDIANDADISDPENGTITYHSAEPSSPTDMSNQLASTVIHSSQKVYVMTVAENDCYDIDSVDLQIEACNTLADVDVIIDSLECWGDTDASITLNISSNPSVNFTYEWNTGETGNSISNLGAGIYSVIITPDNGCASLDTTIIVTQPAELVVDVPAELRKLVDGFGQNNGEATAVAEGGTPFRMFEPYRYLWDDPTMQQTATAYNLSKGTYTVQVTDSLGCTANFTFDLGEEFLIPNGFSPNGDGHNDLFVIAGLEQHPEAYIEVVNRWGHVVYQKNYYGNESHWGSKEEAWWNGKANVGLKMGDKVLPSGTYIYFLRLDPNSSEVRKGTVFITSENK